MKKHLALAAALSPAALTAVLLAQAPSSPDSKTLITFQRIQLSDQFWCEGANFADFNKDGKGDIVSGPWWWEGPDFAKKHEIYPAKETFELALGPMTKVTVPGFHGALGKENTYSDNFFAWPQDFNGDGWMDVLVVGFPGKDASWFENPQGKDQHWVRHQVFDGVDNESPEWLDVTGDGKAELVCIHEGQFGYLSPEADAAKPWKWQPISMKGGWQRFTHGLGVGDVNGDGKMDILEAGGWFEQPAAGPASGLWRRHEVPFADGGAQMFAYDVNGDGLNDVITSVQAHGFGLVWHEQVKGAPGGEITFKKHVIVGKAPEESRYGVKFSELHALALVDMDGDGLKDIVTGKRFWSHGRMGDPDRNDKAVIYWFQLVRGANGEADYVPHLIDDASGVGTQVVAGDVNGDGFPDTVVGNKKGTFVNLQQRKAVSAEEWAKAQPKPLR